MGFAFRIVISSWDLLVSLPLGLEVEKGGEHALGRSIIPISCGVSTNGKVSVCAERAPQLKGSPGEDY